MFSSALLFTLVIIPQVVPIIYLTARGDLSILQGIGALVSIPFVIILSKTTA